MKPSMFVNCDEASAFLKTIQDPIVASQVRYAYQLACTADSFPNGQFDLLYFFKILEALFRDREGLGRVLLNMEIDKTGWGS